ARPDEDAEGPRPERRRGAGRALHLPPRRRSADAVLLQPAQEPDAADPVPRRPRPGVGGAASAPLIYESGYCVIGTPSDGISCSPRQPRVTRASSAATYSASSVRLSKKPSHTTGAKRASTTYCARSGLQRTCRSLRKCSSSAGTSPST